MGGTADVAYLTAVIRFDDVHKRFGARGIAALRGVSFSIAAGESVAVVGPNGAGKSTLLALALGFLHASRGTVLLDGMEARRWVRRHGAGWLPERFALPAGWKVRPALEHFARLDGRDKAAARGALEHFGLAPYADRPAVDLSHGLGRRLALAIATVTPRKLCVLDEPTEGLDAEGKERFAERCRWMREHGTTLLVATQEPGVVGSLTDRVLAMDNGKLLA